MFHILDFALAVGQYAWSTCLYLRKNSQMLASIRTVSGRNLLPHASCWCCFNRLCSSSYIGCSVPPVLSFHFQSLGVGSSAFWMALLTNAEFNRVNLRINSFWWSGGHQVMDCIFMRYCLTYLGGATVRGELGSQQTRRSSVSPVVR